MIHSLARSVVFISAAAAFLTAAAAPSAMPATTLPTTMPVIAQADSGNIILLADSAIMYGSTKVDTLGPIECVVHWRKPNDAAEWDVDVTKPGSFELLLTYACADESAGGTYTIEVGSTKLAKTTVSTTGWDAQDSVIIGLVKVEQPGRMHVAIRMVKKTGEGLMALRGVALRPATEEDVARRIKSAATPTPQPAGLPLIIGVDCAEAPELEDWLRDARLYCAKTYPVIEDAIKTPGFVPPRAFTLRVTRTYQGVAATSGRLIFMAVKYVKGNPNDIGMVGHELTHEIQHYRRANAGWLVEGIADYIRYYVLEPGSPRARFNPKNADYKRGYQPTAGLLAYVVKYYDVEAIRKLNAALRDGSYKDTMFVDMTGETPDELWEDCKAVMMAR